jgi:hypothetical protein
VNLPPQLSSNWNYNYLLIAYGLRFSISLLVKVFVHVIFFSSNYLFIFLLSLWKYLRQLIYNFCEITPISGLCKRWFLTSRFFSCLMDYTFLFIVYTVLFFLKSRHSGIIICCSWKHIPLCQGIPDS